MRYPLACAAVALATGGLLVGIAGPPDLGRSLDLLTGRSVAPATEAAFVTLACWVAWALLAVAAAAPAIARAHRQRFRPALAWALVVFIVGGVTLAVGVARHREYGVCCATPATAHQADQLVH